MIKTKMVTNAPMRWMNGNKQVSCPIFFMGKKTPPSKLAVQQCDKSKEMRV